MGDKYLEVAAPRHWNSIPHHLGDSALNISCLKKQLKTLLIEFPKELH